MRKLFMLVAMCLPLVVACQKEIGNEDSNQGVKTYKSISAIVTDATKTSLDIAGKNLTWKVGDRLMVQNREDLKNKVIFTLDPKYAGKSNGVFRIYDELGNVDEKASITGSEFNVFYLNNTDQPIVHYGKEGTVSILSEQPYDKNGVQDDLIPMCAYTKDLSNINLKIQASVFSIKLKNPDDAKDKIIKSIELSSTRYLTGNMFIKLLDNTREYNTLSHESWSTSGVTVYQRKYAKLIVGDGVSLAPGAEKAFNFVVGRNSYSDLTYTIKYEEGGESKKCIISSSKRTITTNGGETIVFGTKNITPTIEDIYFKVNGTEYSIDNFEGLEISALANIQVRSHRIVGSDEVLNSTETTKALKTIGDKKKRVNIDLSMIISGYTDITSEMFSSVKGYINNLYLPKDVETVTSFYGLGTIGDIYLNKGLTTIKGDGSGFYQQVMGTVHIPSTTTSIGTANFDMASGIVIDSANPNYWTDGVALYTLKDVDGKKVPYMLSSICGRVNLDSQNGVYEIPSTVVGHLKYAHDHAANIKTMVLPAGFKTTAGQHLRYCSNLSCIRFKSTTSLIKDIWTMSSDMPKNGALEIVMPDDSTPEAINESIKSYYDNYSSWITTETGWSIKAVKSNGTVLKEFNPGDDINAL